MENIFSNLWNSTSSLLLALSLLGALQTSQADNGENDLQTADCGESLHPYQAKYDVYRNGKLLGTSSAELSRAANDHWFYQMSTKATKGMGGLLGGKILESARFTEVAGVLRAERYDLLQRFAFSKTKRSAEFDWGQKLVVGKNKRKKWQLALTGDEIDRLSANLRLRQQLAAGKTQLRFKTVEKGELKIRDFEAREAETVVTGLGEMLAIPVHRKHENSKRTTITWHSPQLGYLPVRMEHAKQGDDSGKLILTGFRPKECISGSTELVTQ